MHLSCMKVKSLSYTVKRVLDLDSGKSLSCLEMSLSLNAFQSCAEDGVISAHRPGIPSSLFSTNKSSFRPLDRSLTSTFTYLLVWMKIKLENVHK